MNSTANIELTWLAKRIAAACLWKSQTESAYFD